MAVIASELHVPGISVICPIKDIVAAGRSAMIRRLISSFQSANIANCELIIVIGESSDETQKLISNILSEQQVTNIRLIEQQGMGLYAAINQGAQSAVNKHIMFMGSDDYFLNRKSLNIICESIVMFSDMDYYYWNQLIDNDGHLYINKAHSPSRFIFGNFFCFQSFAIRKDTFFDIGGFSTKYKACSDYDLIFRLIIDGKKGQHLNVATTVASTNGVSASLELVQTEMMQIWTEHLSRFGKFDLASAAQVVKQRSFQTPILLSMFFYSNSRIIKRAALRGLLRRMGQKLVNWARR